MVKYCPKCATKVPDEGLFCPSCGADVRNANDATRRNPLAEVNDHKAKKENNGPKSYMLILLLIILILMILTPFVVLPHNGGADSDDNYNISYKGIYLSGKGTVNKSSYSFNDAISEGVTLIGMDHYHIRLNEYENYTVAVGVVKIENLSVIPNNTSSCEDYGLGYSVPVMVKYTDYSEIESGKNITYAYQIAIYDASHYKFLTTEFLDSIIYPQEN